MKWFIDFIHTHAAYSLEQCMFTMMQYLFLIFFFYLYVIMVLWLENEFYLKWYNINERVHACCISITNISLHKLPYHPLSFWYKTRQFSHSLKTTLGKNMTHRFYFWRNQIKLIGIVFQNLIVPKYSFLH